MGYQSTLKLQESKTTDPSDRIDAHLMQQTFALEYAIPECEEPRDNPTKK